MFACLQLYIKTLPLYVFPDQHLTNQVRDNTAQWCILVLGSDDVMGCCCGEGAGNFSKTGSKTGHSEQIVKGGGGNWIIMFV